MERAWEPVPFPILSPVRLFHHALPELCAFIISGQSSK